MQFLFDWFFLRPLEPEYSVYRITAIKVMGYFMVGVAILESIVMLFGQDWVYLSISIPAIFIFLGFIRQGKRKLHYLANSILIYNLLTGSRLVMTDIDNPSLLLFMPITPLMVIFLVGTKRAIAWIGLYWLVFVSGVVQYYRMNQRLPFEIEFFVTSLFIMGYAIAIAIGMEQAVQALIKKLKRIAERDPLTKAYNRRRLDQLLRHELKRSKRVGSSLALLLIDIDHFKRVNDTWGHDMGDRVLRQVAVSIEANIRADVDILARYGGEEFVVVLPEATPGKAIQVADRIRACIASTKIGAVNPCTASVGVSIYQPPDSVTTLLKRADQGLYLAKERGRDRTESIDVTVQQLA